MVNHHLDTRRQSADPSHTVHSNVDDGRGEPRSACVPTDLLSSRRSCTAHGSCRRSYPQRGALLHRPPQVRRDLATVLCLFPRPLAGRVAARGIGRRPGRRVATTFYHRFPSRRPRSGCRARIAAAGCTQPRVVIDRPRGSSHSLPTPQTPSASRASWREPSAPGRWLFRRVPPGLTTLGHLWPRCRRLNEHGSLDDRVENLL
jgi:hypothetical protein